MIVEQWPSRIFGRWCIIESSSLEGGVVVYIDVRRNRFILCFSYLQLVDLSSH